MAFAVKAQAYTFGVEDKGQGERAMTETTYRMRATAAAFSV
jgi:hypothetical protein